MLHEIESKLKAVNDLVFYGSADPVDNAALWNYIVFWRDKTTRSANATAFTDYYGVGIVHENWVPQETIEAVIAQMESLPGMKLANADIDFEYTRKPSTNAVVEVATLSFAHSRKRV